MSDEVLEQEHETDADAGGSGGDSGPMRQLRDAYKDVKQAAKELRAENQQLREQLEQAAPVRELATEHLALNELGLEPRRAKAAAKLHQGPMTVDGLRETVERYHLDRQVGVPPEGGDDG